MSGWNLSYYILLGNYEKSRDDAVAVSIHDDHLNMVVVYWYLVKSNFSRVYVHVHVYRSIHWTCHFLLDTRKTWPCLSGQVIQYEMIAHAQKYYSLHKPITLSDLKVILLKEHLK